MNTLAIALMIVIALLLAGVIILLIQGRPKADMTAQRLELLERRLAESMYDLRGEQSTLARAARLENQAASDRLSEQIDKRVARLADMTDQNLERIRMTVDERLNQSLEQKFAQVNKCLGEVHQSLGQMQSLSCGVDELRRVLSNVKVRGTWGEMQLGNILKDILDRARYVENAEVRPHSGLRVEYALRLPGQWEQEVLLPIDAKFPLEDYQRLQQAREAGDTLEERSEGYLRKIYLPAVFDGFCRNVSAERGPVCGGFGLAGTGRGAAAEVQSVRSGAYDAGSVGEQPAAGLPYLGGAAAYYRGLAAAEQGEAGACRTGSST